MTNSSVYGRVGDQSLKEGETSVVQIDPTGGIVVKGKTSDSQWKVFRIDPSTHSLQMIDHEHH